MAFNSYSYLLFLIPAIAIFWMLPTSVRRWYVLALSLAYYATWSVAFVAVPLLLCGGVHLAAQALAKPSKCASWVFWSGIGYILAIFLFFRYREFLFGNVNAILRLAGAHPISTALRIAIPLGISFYSFEAISYLIDARQGRIKQSKFSDLYLFVMFWPHLMAGPIVRFRELAPQLGFAKPFEMSMLIRGLDRLVWGLVQKNLIANSLGSWVDEGFVPAVIHTTSTVDNWFLAIAFGLQIYFDFAAYSNMAIGVAQLIGITLPENFRFPYHAHSPAEFWNRWHMTLSRWIRDYLFFPVNVKYRGAPGPLYASLLGIMALVGLWHGAGWGFVLWGTMHGAYLVLYRIWESYHTAGRPSPYWTWVWRAFTLIAVTAAWVPFRAASGGDAAHMLASMFGRFRPGVTLVTNFFLVTAVAVVFCLLEPLVAAACKRMDDRLSVGERGRFVSVFLLRPALYAAGLLVFLIFDDRSTQFIYFQF